jgi:hypothetical protein
MGLAGSKKLPKEDMTFLMDNTNFTKTQIKAWYKGFMVSLLVVLTLSVLFSSVVGILALN